MLSTLIACFVDSDPTSKCARLAQISTADPTAFAPLTGPRGKDVDIPDVAAVGIPDRPELVPPRDLPRRSLRSPTGHAAFIHAICHIEFTAINLALDAALRFSGMPQRYYCDWVAIAREEAQHFELLSRHLRTLGFAYGDFAAHAGLWDIATRTVNDLLLRMALVPRVLEARGLDVTPPMIERLRTHGDDRGAEVLQRIYRDEIRHVEAGTRWFNYVATARGLEPAVAFQRIVGDEFGTIRNNKMNLSARRAAGFSDAELAGLAGT